MSVFFNGRLLVTPAVESAIYDGGMATAYPGRAGNVPVMLGTSEGGIPKQAMFFDSPVTARRALRGGDLLRAVEYAFNPSAESGSPARVAVVRVEEAVQSGLVLKDADGADVIDLKSADYGAHTNSIRVTVEAGGQYGLRATLQHDSSYYTKDNLSKMPLSVRYGGANATATVAVTATTLVLTAAAAVTLTLSDYRSIRELADAVNAQPGFSAVAAIPASPAFGVLDGLAPTSCKAVDVSLKADLQAVIDWMNTGGRDLVMATRVTGALKPPAALAGTYLSGGANGPAPTNEDWQDAFDVLQASDVQWIVPLSVSPSIWYMADAHVQFMSGPGKSERRAFVGGDVIHGSLDSGIQAARDAAMALNSDRTALCFPPILDYVNDQLVPLPAYFVGAKMAGGFGAMNFGNTMTNKVINVPGLDPSLVNIYDSDTLINSGVLCLRKTRRGFVVSKAITTWLANDNYNRVEISTGAALDYVARTVREALEVFIGRKASPITLHESLSATDSALRELARPEPIGVGVIVGDEESPAYRNITAEIQGDILRVWFECSPVIPINYVLVGIYAKAYSGKASAVAVNG